MYTEEMKERGHLEVLGVNGAIIVKWIVNKWIGEA
jgi:hypothetical protein